MEENGRGKELEDKNKTINDLDLLRMYVRKVLDHAQSSVEILYNENYDIETKYLMCVSFLTSMENARLKLLEHQYNIELFGADIEQIDEPYEDFVFELKQAIFNKEDNLTWLQSRYDILYKSGQSAIEALTSMIISNRK